MKWFSRSSWFEVLAGIMINLTAAWISVVLISPGFFNISLETYLIILLRNIPFAILGLVASLWFTQKRHL